MTIEANNSVGTGRRRSVYLQDYRHTNPIPAACRIGNVVYSSAIHGIDSSGSGVSASLEDQAQLMFTRLRAIVEAAGGSTDDVVKVTMWMRDRADRTVVNHFWLQMFPNDSDRPARQTVNAQLDGEQLIQCDFVAVIDEQERGDQRS